MCSHPINKSLNRLKVSFLFRCTIMLGKQIKTTTNQPTKKAKQKKDCNNSELVTKYYNCTQ